MGRATGQLGIYVSLDIPLWNSSQPSSFCRVIVPPAPPCPNFPISEHHFAARLIVLPWRRRQHVPPERRHPSTKLHGVTTQDTISEPPHLTQSLYCYLNLHKILPCWKNNTVKRVFIIPHLEILTSSQVQTAFMLMLLMTCCWKVLTSGGLQCLAVVPSFTKIRHCL